MIKKVVFSIIGSLLVLISALGLLSINVERGHNNKWMSTAIAAEDHEGEMIDDDLYETNSENGNIEIETNIDDFSDTISNNLFLSTASVNGFSPYIESPHGNINAYNKNGNYYLFLPSYIDLNKLTIYLDESHPITGTYQKNETISVTYNGNKYQITIMKSSLPGMEINLKDGLTLETINKGSKDTKYANNSVSLETGEENIFDDDDVEMKGRGNFTWTLNKKAYQI